MKKMILILGALFTVSAHAKIEHEKNYGNWKGVCEKNECGVLQISYDANKQPIGRIILRRMQDKQVVAFVTVPLGVSLKGGMGVAVDQKEVTRGAYDFCDDGGCTAILPLNEKTLEEMRKGKKMQVAVFILDQSQAMEFSLKGSTDALKNL